MQFLGCARSRARVIHRSGWRLASDAGVWRFQEPKFGRSFVVRNNNYPRNRGRWFRLAFCLLPGPAIFPKGHLGQGTFAQVPAIFLNQASKALQLPWIALASMSDLGNRAAGLHEIWLWVKANGISFWGRCTAPPILERILVVGLGCSLGVRFGF